MLKNISRWFHCTSITSSSWSQNLCLCCFPWLNYHYFLHNLTEKKHSFIHLLTTKSRFGTGNKRVWVKILPYNFVSENLNSSYHFSASQSILNIFSLYFPLGFHSLSPFPTGFSSLPIWVYLSLGKKLAVVTKVVEVKEKSHGQKN